MACNNLKCPLHSRREVPYYGNKNANIVFIGESPMPKEREAFSGDAGVLIKKLVIGAGIRWSNLFVMNSARCSVDKKTVSTKDQKKILACCREKVDFAIRAIKPKVIVCLGDFALRQIMKKSGITKSRGRFLYSKEFECWVLPTFHPNYLLMREAMTPAVDQDLRLLVDFIKNQYQPVDNRGAENYTKVESIAGLIPEGSIIGIDTETQGVDWTDPCSFVLISYSVSYTNGQAFQIRIHEECPLDEAERVVRVLRKSATSRKLEEVDVGVKRSTNFADKMSELKSLLESGRIPKLMMTMFDCHVFHAAFTQAGYDSPDLKSYVNEISAAANLLDENLFSQPDLYTLQSAFTTIQSDYKDQFNQKFNKADMLAVPDEDLTKYACSDADVTRQVGINQIKRLSAKGNERLKNYFVKFTMPTLKKSIYYMQKNGVKVDLGKLPIVKEELIALQSLAYTSAIAVLPSRVLDKHKGKLKFTRDEFLRDILFSKDGFDIEPVKKTKGGDSWSTDAETRLLLLDKDIPSEAETFIAKYDEWSELDTFITRYLKGFEKWARRDGRIHTLLSLSKTNTGRLSSSRPNMQNNPKRSKLAKIIRQLLVAEEGHILITCDQGQSELRIAADLANELEMLRVFRSGEDIHTNTARALMLRMGSIWVELSEAAQKTARRNAKAINFGLLYLMQAKGFVRHVKKEYNIDITLEEAIEWMQVFFTTYPRLPEYHKETIALCKKLGYVETPLGRRRNLPEINSLDKMVRAEAERQAVNSRIQEPSSSMTLLANNEFIDDPMYDDDNIKSVLFIHDELIFESKEDADIDKYVKAIKYYMSHPPLERDFGYRLKVPLDSEAQTGHNLSEMKEYK